jgi:hypothetical protein
MLTEIIIFAFASYAFANAVQMIRGTHLNFKPFSCRFCLSWWFSFIYFLFFTLNFIKAVIMGLSVSGIVYLITQIEDRINYYRNE